MLIGVHWVKRPRQRCCALLKHQEDKAIDGNAEGESRLFTLEEALELLPVIKQLFSRFNGARERASVAAEALEELERRRSRANTLELARPLRERREELGVQVEEMREVVREVQEMGVEIKRIDPALIDFRSVRDDHVVYLCWQEGEETISYWHELDTGFAGRLPL